MIKDSEVQQLTPEDFSRTTVSFKKKTGRGRGRGLKKRGKRTWQILKHKGRCKYFFVFLFVFKTDMATGKQNFLGEERK